MRTIPSISSADVMVKRERVLQAAIPLDLNIINTLTQVRQTIDEVNVDELAESILDQGQEVFARAVAFKEKSAREYLKEINELFGSGHRLRDMHPVQWDGEKFYLFLIFGHRRLVACKRAWKLIRGGERSSDNFDGAFLCDIYFELSLKSVMGMQLVENQHVQVPKHEEVAALWRYWRYLQRHNGGVTVPEFAKLTGRKSDRVRDMLRFTGLPETVQARIDPDTPNGPVSFTLLLQVARLVEAHEAFGATLSEEEITETVNFLVVRQTTARDYSQEVTARIAQLSGEQASLFELESVTQSVVRKTAAANLVQAIIAQVHYIGVISRMDREGAFGSVSLYDDGQPEWRSGEYSPQSPARMALRMANQLRELVPQLAELMEKDGRSRTRLDLALNDIGVSYAVFMAVVEGSEA